VLIDHLALVKNNTGLGYHCSSGTRSESIMSMSRQFSDGVSPLVLLVDCWDHPNPFVIGVSAREGDIDSYQHVNNSVYVRWLDECAREHSKAVGIDTGDAGELGYGMAVRDSRITYLASAYQGEEILVGNWLTECDGRLRATRQFQIVRPADGVTLARAELNYICIKIDTGRPSKMPELFREKYIVQSH
jgi:acyl-CoA thioester hydrolase